MEKGFKDGVKDALPTALGYISIGLAFGIVASASDLSAIEVGLMSALVYGGSAQFAMCALLLAKADLMTITITVFLVNLRNMLMSLHATTIFKSAHLMNQLAIGTLVTDESYGVLLGEALHHKVVSPSWMHGNNVMSYLTWVISTIIGTLLGSTIPNPEMFGMLSDGKRLVVYVLASVGLSYFLLATFLSGALSVLLATVVGCSVGVVLDDK
ncbi:AzlC family ABC transporter permease [Streptococcus agalactiae]|uniref:AzlC family ABC transporter permease n=1 Tax=Streptococcus agalactiae TaxID=1311 RepID=UPI0009AAA041|nr:AzlC family ABC transporter permease [Streptococcus agalactiae]